MNVHTLKCATIEPQENEEGGEEWKQPEPRDILAKDYNFFAQNIDWNNSSINKASTLDQAMLELVLDEIIPKPLAKLGFENSDQVAMLMEVDAMFNFRLSRVVEDHKFLHVGSMHGFTEYMLARCGDCAAGFSVSWPLLDRTKSLGKLSLARGMHVLLNCNGTASVNTQEARTSLAMQIPQKVQLAIVSEGTIGEKNEFPSWPQEILSFPGLAGRTALAIECLNEHGNLVVAVGDLACPCSVELVGALSGCFSTLKIVKPLSGTLIDTTRLLVCEDFSTNGSQTLKRLLAKRANQEFVQCFAPITPNFAEKFVHGNKNLQKFLLESSAWTSELVDASVACVAGLFKHGTTVDAVRKALTTVVEERTKVSWPDTITLLLEPKRFVYFRPTPWALNADLGKHAEKYARELQVKDGEMLLVVCVPAHMREHTTLLRVQKRKAEILNGALHTNAPFFKIASKLAPGFAVMLDERDLSLIKVVSAPREPLMYQTEPNIAIKLAVQRALATTK